MADRRTIAKLNKPAWIGLTLSPDQQDLVYCVFDSTSRTLMLVDKFR